MLQETACTDLSLDLLQRHQPGLTHLDIGGSTDFTERAVTVFLAANTRCTVLSDLNISDPHHLRSDYNV